jgi:hypothetical protein
MRTPVEGSAVYVALDCFEGELDGLRGGFALHHRGVMDAGVPTLEVWVAPDSGSGELLGLRGRLDIRVEGKEHFYQLDYSLPGTPA